MYLDYYCLIATIRIVSRAAVTCFLSTDFYQEGANKLSNRFISKARNAVILAFVDLVHSCYDISF